MAIGTVFTVDLVVSKPFRSLASLGWLAQGNRLTMSSDTMDLSRGTQAGKEACISPEGFARQPRTSFLCGTSPSHSQQNA